MISGAVRTLIASTGTTMAVLVTLLIVIGLAMIGVTIWLLRSTRTDSGALAPLEVMGQRQWRKGDADGRQTRLDTVRPLGAPPPTPMDAGDVEPPEGSDPTPPETVVSPAAAAAAEPEAAPDTAAPPDTAAAPENCESSMQESAGSAHTSDEEGSDASDASAAGTE